MVEANAANSLNPRMGNAAQNIERSIVWNSLSLEIHVPNDK